MKIEIEISDLELELINLETKEFLLHRDKFNNKIFLLSNSNGNSYNVCIKYIEILLKDIHECEDEYRLKYPVLFRKYKLERILNENNNRKTY